MARVTEVMYERGPMEFWVLRPRPPLELGRVHLRVFSTVLRASRGMASFEARVALILSSKEVRMEEEIEGGAVIAV